MQTPSSHERPPFLGAYGSFAAALWQNKKGSVLLVYMRKWSMGVLRMMRCNERIRMQQSRASGAVNLLKYGRFCGPCSLLGPCGVLGASPGGPRGVPAVFPAVPGGSRDSPGILGILCMRTILHYNSIIYFSNKIT